MAHLITSSDSLFLADRQPAWHGLGVVKDKITNDDFMTTIGYEVVKEQLYTGCGEPVSTYATVRTTPEGRRIVLGDKLSAEYSVLQNHELLDATKPLQDAGCQLKTFGTLQEGRRVWILLGLQGDLLVGKNDVIKRYILLSNDHTGRQSARVGFTPIRVVCANTLGMAENGYESELVRIRHQGKVSVAVGNVTRLLDTANGQFLAYGEQLDALANTQISQADLNRYVKRVFLPSMTDEAPAATASLKVKEAWERDVKRLTNLQNVVNEIFQVEESVAGQQDTAGTVYGAYQAVNFYLNHLKTGGEEKRVTSLVWGRSAAEERRALEAARELVAAR
jgi:phage/plasmid-like protein (TIGR03299 family)